MAERRPLKAGLKPVDPEIERQFVLGGKPDTLPPVTPSAPPPQQTGKGQPLVKLPFSTRMRADYVTALKRASLERQLAGEEPNTVMDILEEALAPWLREHGYIA